MEVEVEVEVEEELVVEEEVDVDDEVLDEEEVVVQVNWSANRGENSDILCHFGYYNPYRVTRKPLFLH